MFCFSTYCSCPRGFWFADLLATINFLRCCWPFPNEMNCPHPSACSRRWLSAPCPSPSFSELPRSPISVSLGVLGCASNKATSTSWRLLAKRRESSVISWHHPRHGFCSSAQAMLNICITYVQTLKLKGSTISGSFLRIFINRKNLQLH